MSVYNGLETKIFLNQGKYHVKTSTIEKRINVILVFHIFVLIALDLAITLKCWAWTRDIAIGHVYIFPVYPPDLPRTLASANFLIHYLILGFLLPIALVITLELVKIIYTKQVELDADIANPDYNINDVRYC